MYARNDIALGQVIKYEDLQYLKPAMGIPAKHYQKVVGVSAVSEIKSGEPIDAKALGLGI